MDGKLILGEGGPFHEKLDGFVPRDAQQAMASAVASVIEYKGKLVVESGTGTGKTFSYLVPVIKSGRRAIISTGTRHLQEQIFHRDIPTVSDVLNISVNAVLLKGRANYLCRYRLAQNSAQPDLIGRSSESELDKINKWAVKTATGDISEVTQVSEDSPVWRHVTSTSDNCLGGKCPDYDKCFVNKARQSALKSDIVVVNHHLFFSDVTLKTEGFGELLPDHEVVVFDEAHGIVDTAAAFFGFSLSSLQIRDLLSDVLLAEKSERSGAGLGGPVEKVQSAARRFENYCKRLHCQPMILDDLVNDRFDSRFNQLFAEISALHLLLEKAAPAGEGLDKCFDRASKMIDNLETWRQGRESRFVPWLEPESHRFRFHLTPLNIGEHFDGILNSSGQAWIFTSATLAVGDDFSAFCNEIGLEDAESHCWQSPYNFRGNALLYLPRHDVDPGEDGYCHVVSETILKVTGASSGRAFCLFTSHLMMNRVYEILKDDCRWPIFLQGQSTKQHLLDQFVTTKNSVLLGTASFWQGVDVKGEALSCVIIDKLPFAPPSDPVLKRKLQICEENGGSPFIDIQVPGAVLSLKQGAGRLIRSETDRGVLVICDPRTTTKSYGRLFLDSLPDMPVTREIEDVYGFFS